MIIGLVCPNERLFQYAVCVKTGELTLTKKLHFSKEEDCMGSGNLQIVNFSDISEIREVIHKATRNASLNIRQLDY